MRRNLTQFDDDSEIDLLILNELSGENQAKHSKFFLICFSIHVRRETGLRDSSEMLKLTHEDKDSEFEELIGKLGRRILRMN